MIVDHVCPMVVADRSEISTRFRALALERNVSTEKVEAMLAMLPEPLLTSGVFLDKLTGIWRYEFGLPYFIGESLVLGTHMWEQVDRLFDVMSSVHDRLPLSKRDAYLQVLATEAKHQDALVEMLPAIKLSNSAVAEYEVAGLGQGMRTVDWVIDPPGERRVLCDVKRRSADFIQHMQHLDADGAIQDPTHDPALLFKSVEKKFVANSPDQILQGVWIVTDIAQNEEALMGAFAALDPAKVHFAVLNNWSDEAHVLVKRDQDAEVVRRLFGLQPSSRFSFVPGDSRSQQGS